LQSRCRIKENKQFLSIKKSNFSSIHIREEAERMFCRRMRQNVIINKKLIMRSRGDTTK
jgi:hypothetical protein